MAQSEPDREGVSVVFDRQVHSLTAVKKAAYRYLDRFSTEIRVDERTIVCILKFTSTRDPDSSARLVEDFRKEVLDQDLREALKIETESTRNLILAYAFSRTAIISDEKIS